MFYPLPKKIQLVASQAKWSLNSAQSVLLVMGLQQLRTEPDWISSELVANMQRCIQKAQALDIPILDLDLANPMDAMQRLGEYLSDRQQLLVIGFINPLAKQFIAHIHSVSEQICVVNDAVLLANSEHHVQWIEKLCQQQFHHMNTHSLLRLWALSAPKDFVLSEKGIIYAVAEQLALDPLELDLFRDWAEYNLDSVAVVSLVGLWRANGAEIRYEDVMHSRNLKKLIQLLRHNS